jgi:hypothetical protein
MIATAMWVGAQGRAKVVISNIFYTIFNVHALALRVLLGLYSCGWDYVLWLY